MGRGEEEEAPPRKFVSPGVLAGQRARASGGGHCLKEKSIDCQGKKRTFLFYSLPGGKLFLDLEPGVLTAQLCYVGQNISLFKERVP